MQKEPMTSIAVRIPTKMKEAILEIIEKMPESNLSIYIRDSIRNQIKKDKK
jgi:hypothetical protein